MPSQHWCPLTCRVKTSNGQRVFVFTDETVLHHINTALTDEKQAQPTTAVQYHSIVQNLAWPSPADEEPLKESEVPMQAMPQRWYEQKHMAHTLQYQQMLQPAPSTANLQVRNRCFADAFKNSYGVECA